MSAGELLGVGESTKKVLEKYGILTIGDLATANEELLSQLSGKMEKNLHDYANGHDIVEVKSVDVVSPAKSSGHGTTTVRDLVSSAEVWCVILELAQDIAVQLSFSLIRI